MARSLLAAAVLLANAPQDKPDVKTFLGREIIGAPTALEEVQAYLEARIPARPDARDAAEWTRLAEAMRADVLDRVVFRGEAARWRDLPTRVEWAGDLDGGAGYRLRKLRYEAVPGLWVPGILYVPEKLAGKVPVHLAVNGHDGQGKAADYKQARCINLAKRGMIVLNAEWLGMGQLRGPGFNHYAMNQLDLCGTSGLAPFYLSMKRGLDILLSHENADPARVAVHGLSGGGWQTIFISALDPRVTLANPVAGYSSFRTRVRHLKDLGDSEQTPSDLATAADYAHLTAMRAPRPTLLTFCAKDQCCFEAGYALQPLVDAALPVFKLHGKEANLRSHVNSDPGTHNFLQDNREALYRMVGDFFFPGDASFDRKEIDCKAEIRTARELDVELPKDNATFNSLAKALAESLPRDSALPGDRDHAARWQAARRAKLRDLLRVKEARLRAEKVGEEQAGPLNVVYRKLRIDDAFTVPAVEVSPKEPKETAVLFSEAGRGTLAPEVDALCASGFRVLAVDPFYYGESKIAQKDFLFALLVAAVGERPLGIQAKQVAAVCRWAKGTFRTRLTLAAEGPRSGLVAVVAAALEVDAVDRVVLKKPYGSFKEILDQNLGVNQAPELFTFGLLEAFDVKQLIALVAPRPVRMVGASDRAKAGLGGLPSFYGILGSDFDPFE